MATFNKINAFTKGLGDKLFNLGTDQFVIALTNTAHTSTWDRLTDLTQISYTNLSSRNITTTSWTQTSGTAKLILADLTLTATGSVGPFRYVYVYDDTSTNDLLVGYYDYGSSVTLASGDTFSIDFDGTNGLLTNV